MSEKRKLSSQSSEAQASSNASAAAADSFSSSSSSSNAISCHVLSNGYANSPKSLLVASYNNRYLFNCGEGVVRIINEQNLKLPRLKDFFLTRFDWNNVSGLPALLLTMKEYDRTFRIHSPVNVDFAVDKKYKLDYYDYEKAGELCNQDLAIRPIKLEPVAVTTAGQASVQESKRSGGDQVFAYLIKFPKSPPKLRIDKIDLTKYKPGPWLKAIKEGQDVTLDDGTVLKASDYLDTDDSVNRYMLVLDCPDLSYLDTIGQDALINFKQLSLIAHMGQSSVINDPKYLEWVRTHPSTGCMHLYFDETFPNNCLAPIYETQAKLNILDDSMFRLLPGQTDEFKAALHNKKIVAELKKSEFNIHYARSRQVVTIKPKFELVHDEQAETVDNKAAQYAIIDEFYANQRCLPEDIDQRLIRRVDFLKKKLDMCYLQKDKPDEVSEPVEDEPAATAQQQVAAGAARDPLFYPNLVVLGSASASQTTIRNVTGLLVNLSESVNVVLDCGDYTLGQMTAYYGKQGIDSELVKIRAIWLSHVHYDHIGGCLSLLIKRRQAFINLNRKYEKVYLIFPKLFLINLSRYHRLMPELELFDLVELVPNEILMDYSQKALSEYQLNPKGKENAVYDSLDLGKATNKCQLKHFNWGDRERLVERLTRRLGLNAIKTIPVAHIIHSFAIYLDIKTSSSSSTSAAEEGVDESSNSGESGDSGSFKLAFSGDCRPTDMFAYMFKNCDLLVHECTFDNTHQEDAERKRHSTTAEALSIARKMKAKHTLLTHFSNRYGNFAITDDLKSSSNSVVGFSFDFMNVNRTNLDNLAALMPFTEIVFSKSVVANQESIARNESKKNRTANKAASASNRSP